jgi:2-polyprenyl-3-methyl-5-hydroxy-6-metoxy-1,4-benzoquinol methylase
MEAIYNATYYQAWGDDPDLCKRETFKHRLSLIPFKSGKVLDCGSGKGYFSEEARKVGYQSYDLEINRSVNADYRSIGEIKDSFYAIFMSDFIEHIADTKTLLDKTYNLLQESGYLVITTPDTGSLSCKLMGNRWLHYKPEHIRCMNRDRLSMLLTNAGFKVLSITNAPKCLTLDYIVSYFKKYNNISIPLPKFLKRVKMWFSFGEMIVVATK